jgi:hypothetical protein
MSWWTEIKNSLGVSLGLLGKPFRVTNLKKKFGSNSEYWGLQIEWGDGKEEVLLITDFELSRMRERAKKNPEDVAKFLGDHFSRDLVD